MFIHVSHGSEEDGRERTGDPSSTSSLSNTMMMIRRSWYKPAESKRHQETSRVASGVRITWNLVARYPETFQFWIMRKGTEGVVSEPPILG
jgi:hypothetical protein